MNEQASPAYSVDWTPAARRTLAKLPEKIATAVVEFVYGALADNPQRVGKPMNLEMTGFHTARRGEYRVVYLIDGSRRTVEMFGVRHRADAYRPR